MKKALAAIRGVVNRPRVMHYIEIFAAAAVTALYYNRADLLGAHGLNLVGSIAFGACAAGLKAVFEAVRKNVPALAGLGSAPPPPPAAPPASPAA